MAYYNRRIKPKPPDPWLPLLYPPTSSGFPGIMGSLLRLAAKKPARSERDLGPIVTDSPSYSQYSRPVFEWDDPFLWPEIADNLGLGSERRNYRNLRQYMMDTQKFDTYTGYEMFDWPYTEAGMRSAMGPNYLPSGERSDQQGGSSVSLGRRIPQSEDAPPPDFLSSGWSWNVSKSVWEKPYGNQWSPGYQWNARTGQWVMDPDWDQSRRTVGSYKPIAGRPQPVSVKSGMARPALPSPSYMQHISTQPPGFIDMMESILSTTPRRRQRIER